MKYKEWLNTWLSNCVKPMVKPRTYEKYADLVHRHLLPNLGEYDIKELSPLTLQVFTAKLIERYAINTVNGIIALLKRSLNTAVSLGIAEQQFSNVIKCPKAREKKVESLTVKDQNKIEQYILNADNPKLLGILLSLYTGLRIGELLALEWQDIDFIKCRLTISKSCYDFWENGKYWKKSTTTKTASANRTIPLPQQLIPYLKRAKQRSPDSYIVIGKGGKCVSIRSYQRTFELLLRRLKIPHCGFHALRHTFATRALECGMDVKSLSEILGHKNSMITLSRYTHSLMEYKSAMMNKLGKNLNKKSQS